MTHTKSNLIQGNEYYPFGMQTANSWTRESVTGNRYLANGGTELNSTTQLYDLEFRNYDPALGRMYGVDPVAAKYASLTPYNYSFNNPVGFSDPSGADPDLTNTPPANAYYFHNGAGAAGYPGLTYDDWIPQNTRGEYNNAFGWRTDFALGWFNGSGSSLNGASFAYQDRLYKAQAMAGAVANALGHDGETYMTVKDGLITGSEFRSTLQLQREWGGEIAREKYGGNGRMPAGYMPANHGPRIVVSKLKITMATLPRVNSPYSGPIRGPWVAALALYNQFNSKFDIKKALGTLNSRAAGRGSSKDCAAYFRTALEAGGFSTDGRPNYAGHYGPFLLTLGFSPIATTEYVEGDVIVFQGFSGVKGTKFDHPIGHVQMFNGTIWVSDYYQNTSADDETGFWPGGDYRIAKPNWQAYRWEFKWPN